MDGYTASHAYNDAQYCLGIDGSWADSNNREPQHGR